MQAELKQTVSFSTLSRSSFQHFLALASFIVLESIPSRLSPVPAVFFGHRVIPGSELEVEKARDGYLYPNNFHMVLSPRQLPVEF